MQNGLAAMTDLKPLLPLTPDQAQASHPDAHVWLGASAGTGKTQVLSARVLRLLLRGEAPETLLCLTFTKGGATEMAERVHGRLAYWVRAPAKQILSDLAALGMPRDTESIAFARTLFARVLDARGGGLRIQTIHSFCQTLLASFPAEADLAPGFRPLDERDARKLAHNVLADTVSDAIANGDLAFIQRLQRLVLEKNDDFTRSYLSRCARAAGSFAAIGGGLEANVRRALNLPADDVEPLITAFCADDAIDRAGLVEVRRLNREWGTKTGIARAEIIDEWLGCDPDARSATLDNLTSVWLKADGDFRSMAKGQAPPAGDYAALCAAQEAYFGRLIDKRRRQLLANQISDALIVGQHYARAYNDAKRAQGLVDFDDLIEKSAALLNTPGMGEWIRFKLDSQINHILVDEAQDTNDQQWDIIKALADEFYTGHGRAGDKNRTIFTVGDTKQAIFGFQGSDPSSMGRAHRWFDERARGVGRDIQDLTLQGSFRSSPEILALVDTVIDTLGSKQLGIEASAPRHRSQVGQFGHVLLAKPLANEPTQHEEDDPEHSDASLTTQHLLARDIARRVADWLAQKMPLEDRRAGSVKPKSRAIQPKDIMILLRSRSTLAQLIVAHLTEAGVPVAGVDRLRLNTPLVVRDLLSAIHFVLQPQDDLNLACLLVSPLLGWSQEELQIAATGRGPLSLWRYLRASAPEEKLAPLRTILSLGDRLTPARFIEAVLSGTLRGRQKCYARFGGEARDPLDELLNAAIIYERDHVPTLQGFVDWFERDMDEIKRDADTGEDAVRVLTVHGAKGLQAPVVILADATQNPEQTRDQTLDWPLNGQIVPIPMPKIDARVDEIASVIAESETRALAEHWRLLYVALTRAEEKLVIMGALGARALSHQSWYAAVEAAMERLGATENDDESRVYGTVPPAVINDGAELGEQPQATQRPDWLDAMAPRVSLPARPLAPSAYTVDQSASPPPTANLRAAAERGRILHALFERLPDVPSAQRWTAADAWLTKTEAITDPDARSALIEDALRIIDDPKFEAIFDPGTLAEAPLAGVVNGVVVAGTVDRLLITPDAVMVVDFKTARRIPSTAAAIPESHLRQMAAYVAVLSNIFTDRPVRAGLLYTSGPAMFVLEEAALAAHKPSYQLEQQVLSGQA